MTKKWLEKNNFPKAPIVLRSESVVRINWKLTYAASEYDTLYGIVDNTAENLCGVSLNRGRRFYFNRFRKPIQNKALILVCSWKDFAQKLGV